MQVRTALDARRLPPGYDRRHPERITFGHDRIAVVGVTSHENP
jgi:hypothetical protein